MMPDRAPLGPVVLHMGDPVACTYLNIGGVVNAVRSSGDIGQVSPPRLFPKRQQSGVIGEMTRPFAINIQSNPMQMAMLCQARAQARRGGADLVKEPPQGCFATIGLEH